MKYIRDFLNECEPLDLEFLDDPEKAVGFGLLICLGVALAFGV